MRILAILVVVVAVLAGSQSIYTVHETEQALILEFQRPVDTVNEVADPDPGLHFKTPFITDVIMFDKRNIELDLAEAEIQASDQVRLIVDAFLRYRIDDPLEFYEAFRDERGATVRLQQIMDDSLRGVIASIPSQDVISGQRAELMERVQAAVESQVASGGFGIEVIDVRILRADLPQQIADNVFQRMRSEREQEAARIRAEGEQQAAEIRADADRQARIIEAEANRQAEILRGEGDARRNAIYADAYGRDPEFFAFYRSMVAYEQAVQDGTPIVIPPDSEFFEYFRSQDGG